MSDTGDPRRVAGVRLRTAGGFTLIELAVVAAVFAVLAALLLPHLGETLATGRTEMARAGLIAIRKAIWGTPEQPGFGDDLREQPVQLGDLLRQPATLPSGAAVQAYDPIRRTGWNGPYLQAATRVDSGGATRILDPWGRFVVLQRPLGVTPAEQELHARLVSAGPDGVIGTPATALRPDPDPSNGEIDDDIVVYLRDGGG